MRDSPTRLETVRAWVAYQQVPQGVQLRGVTAQRTEVELRVTLPLPSVVRLQMQQGLLQERASEMLVLRAEQSTPVGLVAHEEAVVVSSSLLEVHVNRDPWQVWVEDANGVEVFAEHVTDRTLAGEWQAPPLGWEERAGRRWVRETFHLTPDEAIFGLGEQTGPLNHRGQIVRCAGQGLPFLWSTRGYGLFFHTYGDTVFELGSRSPASCTVTADDEQLDCFVIYGPSPAEILRHYATLTGQAPVPPRWAFGSWLMEGGRADRSAVEETCATMRARHIPCDVVCIEGTWSGGGREEGSALAWGPQAFAQAGELVAELRQIGFRVGLVAGPHVPAGTTFMAEALRRGLLVRDGHGEPLVRRWRGARQGLVDLTMASGRAWWRGCLRKVLTTGVSALLIAPAEVPAEGDYHDGTPGRWLRSRYSLLCQEVAREAMREQWGRSGLVGVGGAWAGSQRAGVYWGSSTCASATHMMAQLRAGLSLGLSGVPFWMQEIGGSADAMDQVLYTRWCQLGFLSSFSLLRKELANGLGGWGRETESVFRQYAGLRHRLVPYLYSSAAASARSGLPLMRPLVLAYPEDRNTWSLDRQYLLGEHLLVAPVWEGETDHEVYLPPGLWLDYWTDVPRRGPGWVRYHAPLDRLPLLVRAGAIVPTQPLGHFVGERPFDLLTLNVYPQCSGRFTLYDDAGNGHEIVLQVADDRLELAVPPLEATTEVVLHGVPAPAATTLDGRSARCDWSEGRAHIALGEAGLLAYQARRPLDGREDEGACVSG